MKNTTTFAKRRRWRPSSPKSLKMKRGYHEVPSVIGTIKKIFQMKVFLSLAVFSLLLWSCRNSPSSKDAGKTSDTTHFYPVVEYLNQQIEDVDNTPYFIYKISIKDGKKDSSVINQKTFDSLAHLFVKDDITKVPLKKYYTENIFEDVSTDSYTISYTSSDPKTELQNVDILLGREDQQVKWIFMNKIETKDSSIISFKMGWRPDRRFYINKISTDKTGKEHEEQNTIVWNDKQ